MRCLYCNKRLWLIFWKERTFCSKLHEAAYHDGQSAMNRLIEFTRPAEAPKSEPKMPQVRPDVVPPICNFIVDQTRPKPVAADLAATPVLLEAEPFVGTVQFPSTNRGVIASTFDSPTEPAAEIPTIANEWIAACRVPSKRSRRILARPAAFSSRTHRRRR